MSNPQADNMNTVNRAAVFAFFDKDGTADECTDYYLKQLSEHISRLVVVCNGTITYQTRALFRKYTNEILVRENKGYDAWAWKEGIGYIGWENLQSYDELILANDSAFGPVYPFHEMFEEMSPRGFDFWGLLKLAGRPKDPTNCNPYGLIPEYLESTFVVYGRNLLLCGALKEYWDKLPDIENKKEATGKHETYFTKFFADKGYRYDAYIDAVSDKALIQNAMLYQPEQLLREHRCPLVKCKLFSANLLDSTEGEKAAEALHFLRRHTQYDTDLIIGNVIRRYHLSDIVRTLGLSYILPDDYEITPPEQKQKTKPVALIMHLYFPDMFDEALHYASSMPEDADIYISTNEEEKAAAIRKIFGILKNRVEVRIVENTGRSESALLVGMSDVIKNYEYICFWKEKKSPHTNTRVAPYNWAKKINENLLGSKEYVCNVIATFDENPRLGLLMVATPNHSLYWGIPGNEWTICYKVTTELSKELGLDVPMSKKKPPVAPFGGAFWFRSKALIRLFEHGWAYSDFPEEPLPVDGSLLHAIERIYSFVAQDAGYYVGYVMNPFYARLEYTNEYYYLRSFNRIRNNDFTPQTYKKAMAVLGKRLDVPSSLVKHIKFVLKKRKKAREK